ncbi:MAG: 30S ribosomal protein S6 [Candidatus Phytoplasma australasiaticum]|nr:30S ribosomal protein S6 [Candidatus Phytoplasma australasiaticum]
MKEYELMYIIKPNISQEQAQEIVENLKKTMERYQHGLCGWAFKDQKLFLLHIGDS